MDKLIFLNVGWMSKYTGPDQIVGGGKYIALHGFGHEMWNFKPLAGKMYGTAAIPKASIKLERLGAAKGAESVDGVLVVWVAKSRIVGWYENATVHRHLQPPKNLRHTRSGGPIRYYVTASESDCVLLDPNDRHLSVPRASERANAMGRYLWYAEGTANRAFRVKVFKYVAAGGKISALRNGERAKKAEGLARQSDPEKKAEVERAAINLAELHFKTLGYDVRSVEADNVGWDLNAVQSEIRPRVHLRLEVKGLSGRQICVELTPQEYTMMQKYKQTYRICVVTNCLEKALSELSIFAYDDGSHMWVDGDDRPLQIKELRSARLFLRGKK